MNRFWQQTFDQTTCRFNHLAEGGLQVGNPSGPRTLRICFSHCSHPQTTLIKNIFNDIIGIGFVPSHPGLLGQIKTIPSVGASIAVTTRAEEEFNRLSAFSDHHMNFETIEIALFTGLVATPHFALVPMGAGECDNYRKPPPENCPRYRPPGDFPGSRKRPADRTSCETWVPGGTSVG